LQPVRQRDRALDRCTARPRDRRARSADVAGPRRGRRQVDAAIAGSPTRRWLLDGDPIGRAWTVLQRSALRSSRRGLIVVDDVGERRPSSLWTLVHVLWAACDVADLGRTAPVDELTALLERYRRGDGYGATPHGRRYFDDNAWLGLVSLRLAQTTGSPHHQARAKELIRFVKTGEDPSGGVRWREGSRTRNTCSTAAAA